MALKSCCVPLQTGVKAIAIFEMIKSAILTIWVIINLVKIISIISNSDSHYEDPYYKSTATAANAVVITFICLVILMLVINFALGILLFKAAQGRNQKYLKIWLIVTCVLLILAMLQFFNNISRNETANTIINAVEMVLKMYFIWVVVQFRKEVLEQDAQGFVVSGGSEKDEAGPSARYKTGS